MQGETNFVLPEVFGSCLRDCSSGNMQTTKGYDWIPSGTAHSNVCFYNGANISSAYSALIRNTSTPFLHTSNPIKAADQTSFCEFDLPKAHDGSSQQCDVSKLPWISKGTPQKVLTVGAAHIDSPDEASSRSPRNMVMECTKDTCEESVHCKGALRMTRVDWRWAALKGFWDKDNKCWIESAGGQAAYIQQRANRIEKRAQRKTRNSKASDKIINIQPQPFRTGLMEELPYNHETDPWESCFLHGNAPAKSLNDVRKFASEANPAASWFDAQQGTHLSSVQQACRIPGPNYFDSLSLSSSSNPATHQAPVPGPANAGFAIVNAQQQTQHFTSRPAPTGPTSYECEGIMFPILSSATTANHRFDAAPSWLSAQVLQAQSVATAPHSWYAGAAGEGWGDPVASAAPPGPSHASLHFGSQW